MHLDDLDVEFLVERRRDLLVSTASRLTPRLMLPDFMIAVFFAASATLASSAADMPVVPMMWTSPRFRGERGERHGRGRHCEIDDAVGRERARPHLARSP